MTAEPTIFAGLRPPLAVDSATVLDGGMSKSPRTVTVPEGKQPPAHVGPELITAVRERGGTTEYVLLAKQSSFTVGSSRAATSCSRPTT